MSSAQALDVLPASNVRRRLIEVAARHFAEHGIQGASQRAIQREVGVNNSTVNYHFGSKEALYRAVIDEALSRIQASRMSGLEELPADLPVHERVHALLTAYLGAHLREATSELGYNYLRIVAALHLVVPDAAAEVIEERIKPVREIYVDAIAKLFPNASRNRIYEVLQLAVGLMAMAPIRFGQTRITEPAINRMVQDVVAVSTIAFETLCGFAGAGD